VERGLGGGIRKHVFENISRGEGGGPPLCRMGGGPHTRIRFFRGKKRESPKTPALGFWALGRGGQGPSRPFFRRGGFAGFPEGGGGGGNPGRKTQKNWVVGGALGFFRSHFSRGAKTGRHQKGGVGGGGGGGLPIFFWKKGGEKNKRAGVFFRQILGFFFFGFFCGFLEKAVFLWADGALGGWGPGGAFGQGREEKKEFFFRDGVGKKTN